MRGRVVALGPDRPAEGVVVRDLWAPRADPPMRIVVAHDFAVVGESGPEVIVRLERAPTLIADPTHGALEDFPVPPPDHGTAGEGDQYVLCAGDEVELLGRVVQTIPSVARFDLGARTRTLGDDDSGSPYRQTAARPGLLVGGEAPVRIVRTS